MKLLVGNTHTNYTVLDLDDGRKKNITSKGSEGGEKEDKGCKSEVRITDRKQSEDVM